MRYFRQWHFWMRLLAVTLCVGGMPTLETGAYSFVAVLIAGMSSWIWGTEIANARLERMREHAEFLLVSCRNANAAHQHTLECMVEWVESGSTEKMRKYLEDYRERGLLN